MFTAVMAMTKIKTFFIHEPQTSIKLEGLSEVVHSHKSSCEHSSLTSPVKPQFIFISKEQP